MAININEFRLRRASLWDNASPARPSATKQIVSTWHANQREYNAALFRGKFASQPELVAYLECELGRGTRSRADIAYDAGMSRSTFANYMKKGKVREARAINSLPVPGCVEEIRMSDLFWLTDEQVERLRQFIPTSRGKPRADDRRVLSGIVFVNQNGLRWRDAPSIYGPYNTLYRRWKQWGDQDVFGRMMEGLSEADAEPKIVMIVGTYVTAHRKASSLQAKKEIAAA